MHILVLTSLNPSTDIRIYQKQIKSLIQKYNVTYICASEKPKHFYSENYSLLEFEKPNNIQHRVKNLLKLITNIEINKFDIIHIHNPELLTIVPILKKRNKNVKIIFDMHEDFEAAILDKEWIPNKSRLAISKVYKSVLNQTSKKYLDHIIVTTPLKKEKYGYLGDVSVIENFAPLIDKITYKKIDQNVENFLINNRKNLKLIITGLINKDRGIMKVLESLTLYNKVCLTILGVISNDLKQEILRFLKINNLEYRVYIKESVAYEDMVNIMNQMDVGLVPYLPVGNHVVTRPNKLFEYMMTKLAVIASDFPLYREVLEQECGILVNPENPVDFAKAYSILKEDSYKLEMYKENGYKLYLEKYNWNIEEKKLFEIYQNIIGE